MKYLETQQVDPRMKYTLIGLVIVLVCECLIILTISTIYFSENFPNTPIEFAREYGDTEEFYEQILTSNDCAWLKKEYNEASIIYQIYYPDTSIHKRASVPMKAAGRRMKEINCYD